MRLYLRSRSSRYLVQRKRLKTAVSDISVKKSDDEWAHNFIVNLCTAIFLKVTI